MGVATWGECRRCHRTCRFYEGGLCSRCWEREGRMTEADWLACDDPARMLEKA